MAIINEIDYVKVIFVANFKYDLILCARHVDNTILQLFHSSVAQSMLCFNMRVHIPAERTVGCTFEDLNCVYDFKKPDKIMNNEHPIIINDELVKIRKASTICCM